LLLLLIFNTLNKGLSVLKAKDIIKFNFTQN
jgi:hypothetical protein